MKIKEIILEGNDQSRVISKITGFIKSISGQVKFMGKPEWGDAKAHFDCHIPISKDDEFFSFLDKSGFVKKQDAPTNRAPNPSIWFNHPTWKIKILFIPQESGKIQGFYPCNIIQERHKNSSALEETEIKLDEWSKFDTNINTVLRQKGYKKLGSGVDQKAYLEPGTGQVLKIFGTQDSTHSVDSTVTYTNDHKMFFKFADYCMKNSNNPFLPKFDGWETFIFDNKTYLQIRQEKLSKIPEASGNSIECISDYIKHIPDNEKTSDKIVRSIKTVFSGQTYYDYEILKEITRIEKLLGPDGFAQFLLTMSELCQIAKNNGYGWDLHADNVMLRNKIPVIIDPWVIPKNRR
jgi:hypothetical protein